MTSDLDPTPSAQVTRGQIIVVASPKGGVGKSTVATNLAILLAKQAPLQTVLVDLDLQFGDVASQLDLQPDRTISDVVSVGLSDTMLFKTFLASHSSGLLVLAGVESPVAGGRISDEQVEAVLKMLASEFPVVIVDTASGLGDHTLAALELATDVVFVTNMGVSSIKSLRRELDLLAALDLSFTRHVVLNFCDRISGLTVEVAAGVVGHPVDVVLPRVEDGPLAANLGIPIVLRKKPGVMGQSLSDLASRLGLRSLESPVEAEAGRWRSKRWRSQGGLLSAEHAAALEQAPEPEQSASRMSWRERKSKRGRGEEGQAQEERTEEERTEEELAPYGLAGSGTGQVARAKGELAEEESAEEESDEEESDEGELAEEESAEEESDEGELAEEESAEGEQDEEEQDEEEQDEEEEEEDEPAEEDQAEEDQAEEDQAEGTASQDEQGGRRKRREGKGWRLKGVEEQAQGEASQNERGGRRKRRDGKRRRVRAEKEQAERESSQEEQEDTSQEKDA